MKIAGVQLASQAMILVVGFTTACGAEDTVSKHTLQAKVDYCETCHGLSGRGFRGYYPIPRLAGQQTEYIENQLRAFSEHRRTSNIMFNVSHVLSPDMITALAKDFHDLDAKPLGGAPQQLAAEGKRIYEEGIAASDIPPCASCHGPEAKGQGEIPRLAGQLNDYILRKLTHWSEERGQIVEKPDTSAIMQPIAHSLSEPQIKAVAAYVSSLE